MSEPRRVHHAKFGVGTVRREAPDKKLEIAFDSDAGSTRLLLPQFVKPVVGAEAEPGPPRSLGDPLLDAVLANPSDEPARAAYRDARVAAGDPRGEAIVLGERASLTDEERDRLRAIERQRGGSWLGPLDRVLQNVTFARGFLDTATVRGFDTREQAAVVLGHPLWATARELTSPTTEIWSDLLTHPCLRSLKRATLSPAALSTLARRSEAVPIEDVIAGLSHSTIDFSSNPTGLPFPHGPDVDDPAAWADALRVGALQNLRGLTLWLAPDNDAPVAYGRSAGPYRQGAERTDASRVAWLLSSPLGEQLEALDVAVGSSPSAALNLGTWIDAVRAMRSLRRAVLRVRFESVGPLLRAVPGLASSGYDTAIVAFVIEREPSGSVGLRIQTDARYLHGLAILERIRGCLGGFPRRDVARATLEQFDFARPAADAWVARLRDGLAPLFEEIAIVRGEIVAL